MSKHTPGSWKLSVDGCNAENNQANVIEGADGSLIVYGQANDGDARLIATAPELLEALEIMIYGNVRSEWSKPTFDQARSAIAKATGETK